MILKLGGKDINMISQINVTSQSVLYDVPKPNMYKNSAHARFTWADQSVLNVPSFELKFVPDSNNVQW